MAMETIFYQLCNFTPTQGILIITCLAVIIALFVQNVLILCTLGGTFYITFRIVSKLSLIDVFYDSTLLLPVVDFIRACILKVELFFHLVETKKVSKYDCVQNSNPNEETESMVDFIVRDFVETWFVDLSDNTEMVEEAEILLKHISQAMLLRLENVNKFTVIQDFADLFKDHLSDIGDARNMMKKQPNFRKKRDRNHEFKMIKTEVEAFASLGKYHVAVQERTSEIQYLRSITNSIMRVMFPPEAFDCYVGKEFLSEIVTINVLLALVDMISQSYWLHKILILLLSDDELIYIDSKPACEIAVQGVHDSQGVKNEVVPDEQSIKLHQIRDVEESDNQDRNSPVDSEVLDTNGLGERLPPLGSSLTDDSPITNFLTSDSSSEQSVAQNSTSIGLAQQHVRPNSLHGLASTASHSSSSLDSMAGQQHIRNQYSQVAEEDTVSFKSWGSSSSTSRDVSQQNGLEIHIDDSQRNQASISPDQSRQEISGITEASDALGELEDEIRPTMRFIDVDIVHVENMKDTGSGTYVLYTIEYTSWHQIAGKWELKRGSVRRRYREFVTLHDRLDEHQVLKKYMTGIKGPQRWGIIPNTKVDGPKTEKRRHFLSEYLRCLIFKEELCNCIALKEFLAYEGDGSIAFVRNAPDNLPRFDKMFFSTVKNISGVIDKISNVLPSLPDPNNVPTVAEIEKRRNQLQTVDISNWQDPHQLELEFAHLMVDRDDASDFSCTLKNSVRQYNGEVAASLQNIEGESAIDEEEESNSEDEFYDANERPKMKRSGSIEEEKAPLASLLLDLAIQTIQEMDTWVRQEKTVTVAKATLATFLQRFIEREVDDVTTRPCCTYYLRRLRDTLWPDGELDREESIKPSDEQRYVTCNQARDAIEKFFPGWLPYVIGHEEYQHSINTVMSSLEHEKINRHFAYKALDMVLDVVFPELSVSELQTQLLTPDHIERDTENTSLESLA